MILDDLKNAADIIPDEHDNIKIWTLSTGENASKWDEFKNQGIIAIGWDEVGEISDYSQKTALTDKLKQLYGSKNSHTNDSLALWQFCNEIQIGDYIIAKKGTKTLLGVGVVTSEYQYDFSKNNYKHIRKVEWKRVGEWVVDDKLSIKTLTEITSDNDMIHKLLTTIYEDNFENESLQVSNAQFIKWFSPLIEALKQLNGQGSPDKVCALIANNLKLHDDFLNQTGGKLNQNIFKNQVAWARQYLKLAGFLDGTVRGIWKLSESGYKVQMTDELATIILKNRGLPDNIKLDKKTDNIWWLNANPKIWSFNDIEVGQNVEFTSLNEKGNKRQIYKNFCEVKVGDKVIGYETDTKAIVAICEIVKEHDGKEIGIKKVKNLSKLIYRKDLDEYKEFKNKSFQGSLFKLTKEEYEIIENLINEPNDIIEDIAQDSIILGDNIVDYTVDDFLGEVFISKEQYGEISHLLQNKKNIILQGAPGVGKTFTAKRLAYSLIGKKDNSKIEMVQFHQNYSYEDFVMGFRPSENSGFELRNGVFHNFCIKASNDPKNSYYFIIDEINRGNMSKIFGELLMLIENDKRGSNFAIPLTYKPDKCFYVPENVHIIGMMNTADRSLAMIDYALRRRFCFVELEPAFESNQFVEHLKNQNIAEELIVKINNKISALNNKIEQDNNLGKGFRIGHSYFCNPVFGADDYWYNNVIKYEIIPLLEEYWFDNDEEVKTQKEFLLG